MINKKKQEATIRSAEVRNPMETLNLSEKNE